MIQLLGDTNGAQAFDKLVLFNGFIHHASMVRDAGMAYWGSLLKGPYPTHLPRQLWSSNYANASANGHTIKTHPECEKGTTEVICLKAFSQIPRSEGDFSAATVFSTGCALALSKATGLSAITF